METDLTQYIDKYFIGEYRSPEQIAGKWNLGHKDKKEKHITHPTIYDYIYAKYDKEILKKCMRRKGKKYKHGKRDKTKIPNRVNIDQRPEEANTRSEF